MSYILDALRKSDRERQIGQAPQIGLTQSTQSTQNRSLFFWVLIILIAFNTALFAYLLSTNRSGPTSSESQIQKASNRPTAVISETPTGRSVKDTQILRESVQNNGEIGPRIRHTKDSKSRLKPANTDVTKSPPEQQAKNKIKQKLKSNTNPVLTDRSNTKDKTITPPVESTSKSTQSILKLKPQKQEPDGRIPTLQNMPKTFQQEIPAMNINVYVYSDVPKEQFVIIDMQKYRVGERIANGPVLEKIEQDMMILQYNGRKFKVLRP